MRCTVITDDLKTATENTFIRCHPRYQGVVCPVTYTFPVGMIPKKVIAALRFACSVWAASPRSIWVVIRGKHVLSPDQRTRLSGVIRDIGGLFARSRIRSQSA